MSGNDSDPEYCPSLFTGEFAYDTLKFNFDDIKVTIHTQETENQHVQPSTGMLLWPASNTLCEFMVKRRHLFMGKTVLELGSGVGLCGIVAAHLCSRVILTDADLDSLKLLHKNIETNSVSKNVDTIPLMWGDNDSIAKFIERHGDNFELIIGSDLIYQSRSLSPLFYTVDKLLSHSPEACFILAFFDRNNHFPQLMRVLQEYKFNEEHIEISSFSQQTATKAQLIIFNRKT